jgi:uncharacterized OsmC-like protein
MIGSLMSRMGMAEKLSVAQLQKAVQDGTLPAYVGVPLIQDKLKQAQEAKAAGAQQPHQPPIAQQVMQAAEQHGIDEAQSNLPTQEMAGGGIVAFAGGGLYDDDDEEDDTLEERQQSAEAQSLFNAAANRMMQGAESEHGIESLAAAPTAKEAKETAFKINPESRGGIGIKDVLAAKAAEHKLPPELLNKIAGIESGYKSTAANPHSSAKGLFQFTDATWKGMGGKEGEQFNPEKNAELGAKFVRQNAEGLKHALGRNPTYGEVYASHFFGLKGAKDLLNMDPRTPMDQAVSASVLKANPQLKDKTVGQVMASLNNKMGEGIVALAKGGEVKRFGLPDSKDQLVSTDNPYAMMGDIGASSSDYDNTDYGIGQALKRNLMGIKTQDEVNKERFKTPPSKTPMGPTNEELKRPTAESKALEDITKELAPKEDKTEGKGIDSAVPKEPSIEQQYMDLIKGRQADTKKQRSIDNYMSLLQAGLGMMGGTSPYAMANIGQGAATGIAAKMAAEKNRIAEEAATMKGYGNLYSTQQNAKMREALAGQSQEAAMRKQQFATLGNLEQKTRASIMASLDKSMNTMGLSDEEKARKVDQLTAQALAQSQAYRTAYKAYNGYDFTAPPAVGGGNVDVFGTYGLKKSQQ